MQVSCTQSTPQLGLVCAHALDLQRDAQQGYSTGSPGPTQVGLGSYSPPNYRAPGEATRSCPGRGCQWQWGYLQASERGAE